MNRPIHRRRRKKSLNNLIHAALRGRTQAMDEITARALGGCVPALGALLVMAWQGNEYALDGLIVMVLRGGRVGADDLSGMDSRLDFADPSGKETPLSEAYERALDKVGPDFVDHILESTRLHRAVPDLRIWPGPYSGAS